MAWLADNPAVGIPVVLILLAMYIEAGTWLIDTWADKRLRR